MKQFWFVNLVHVARATARGCDPNRRRACQLSRTCEVLVKEVHPIRRSHGDTGYVPTANNGWLPSGTGPAPTVRSEEVPRLGCSLLEENECQCMARPLSSGTCWGLGGGRGRCCRIYDGIAPLYIAWNLVWETPIRGVVGCMCGVGMFVAKKGARQWQDAMRDTPHSHSPPTSNLSNIGGRTPSLSLGTRVAREDGNRAGGIGLTRVPAGPASVPDARPELLVRR